MEVFIIKRKLLTLGFVFTIFIFLNQSKVLAYDANKTVTPDPSILNTTSFYYTVKSGDSLWKISKNYNTSISSIMSLNNRTTYTIYIGENLLIKNSSTQTVNYKVSIGDTLWGLSKKFNTSINTIKISNYLISDYLMIGEILTIPVNSTQIVKPIGIEIYSTSPGATYGDVYTWKNARRLFTVDTQATLMDFYTGITFNIKYYGGSNHADIIPLTLTDTNKLKKIFTSWSWTNRPMLLMFYKDGVSHTMAVSMAGMPHSTTNIYNNGITGHFDLYFLNSTSHVSNSISETHQFNVLRAGGLR
ncbi:MAG: LysM peptidoglycan-binding domain-containing protein [Clostridiaceae bacterium]